MRTRNNRTRIFSTRFLATVVLSGVAFTSGIIVHENSASAQGSPPRSGTDSRPSEPPQDAKPAAKPTAKPSATPSGTPAKTGTKPGSAKPQAAPTSLETSRKFPKVVTKLIIDDLQVGRGRLTKPGSRLVLHFHSWLYDPTQPLGRGPQFESTQGKAPYKFVLQNPDQPHIKGWEEGLVDMKVGGKRRLIIPPDMAYGANGAGQVIPPGATLLYEIELIDVE